MCCIRQIGRLLGPAAVLLVVATGATSRSAAPPALVAASLLTKADAPRGWTWTSRGTNPSQVIIAHAHVYVGVTQVTEYLTVYATPAQARQNYHTLWAPPPYRLRLPSFGVERMGFRAPFSWMSIGNPHGATGTDPWQGHVYQAFDDAWFWRGLYVVQLNVVTDVPPSEHPAAQQAWAQLQAVFALNHYAQLIDQRISARQ